MPAAGGGQVVHREIIQFQVQEEGTQRIRNINQGIKVYNDGRREAIALDEKQQMTYQNAAVVQDTYATSTRSLTRNIHMANIAVLGMNMSLLGLSWNLQRAGIFSEETNEKIIKIVAPIQMVASVINFAASAWQLYNIVSKMARVQSAMNASVIAKHNTILTISFGKFTISVISAAAALGGLAAIMGAFITKSPALRAVLSVLGSAMLVYAFRTLIAAKAKILLNSQLGPVGWGIIIAGLAIATYMIAQYASLGERIGLWKGGIATGRTQATIGELGPEAVIPLNSPTGRRMLGGRDGGGGGYLIEKAYFSVRADRPATLFKETDRAVKRQGFVEE